ncbi:MAG: 5-(carboxyamino)imidazole ribonucleotide mutase [Candidatus Bathyarchaeia archaeon]|nr:5-(carboxyamino)imidazole ribonucleotide mutase [Candidatus Bathyarchaeota archaeon]
MKRNNKKLKKLVAVVLGSESDNHIAEKTIKILEKFNIPYEKKILSAHRNPKELSKYIDSSKVLVFIAIAGLSAQLSGFIASRTSRPVIGVPVNVKLEGLDALLATMQMPKQVPVATVGIDNGENAAFLAIRILSLSYPELISNLER